MSQCHGLQQCRPTSEELGMVTGLPGRSAVTHWSASAQRALLRSPHGVRVPPAGASPQ